MLGGFWFFFERKRGRSTPKVVIHCLIWISGNVDPTITIDDVSPATTSSRQQYTRPWEAIVLKILRKKIQDAIVEVRTGNGVQFTLDIDERNEIRGSNLAVRLRKNFKECYSRMDFHSLNIANSTTTGRRAKR